MKKILEALFLKCAMTSSRKRTRVVRPFNLAMRIIHVLHLNVRIVAQLLINCLAVGKRLTFLNFFFPMNF